MKKILFSLLLIISVFTIVGCDKKINIVESETSKIEYEDFNNGLVSLKIPKGWKVEVAPADYIHYSFKVFNPENKDYMFLFGLKQEGFLKSAKARNTYKRYYKDSMFAKLEPIDPQTTEAFYKVWTTNARFSNKEELDTEYFPYLNDWTVIENFGKTNLGGDILRATFNTDSGVAMQGLFTATVKSPGSYYMYGADVSPLNVYNIILMATPEAEFNEWQDILDYCISTIEFSESFVKNFNGQEATLVATIQANQKIYDSIGDMIMDSWNKRNNSYDIISQKRSDATLGYERVYDTETGDVYKAYNGFTDGYDGERYKPVTDDMYTKKISGYIEK